MATSTPMPCSAPFFNTGTQPTLTPSYPQLIAYLVVQSRTSYLLLAAREEALRNRHMPESGRKMDVGDHVRIQNQTGTHHTKWDKTGLVIEIRQFDQYVIRVDDSGRTTLRNRNFLRKYQPVQRKQPLRTITIHERPSRPCEATMPNRYPRLNIQPQSIYTQKPRSRVHYTKKH